jgi:hypothetical protein
MPEKTAPESAAAGFCVSGKVKCMRLGGVFGVSHWGQPCAGGASVEVVESLVEGLKGVVEMLSSPMSIPSPKIMADFEEVIIKK